ncbi:MAG: YbaB/EbfC family nucleoid-associated protein [Alphaproteobacteria bacterium]|jgi:DNA-binding YbaB/EbfC family protein|nr:YbaB/EbfC family nucleoid-associated protein [Tagaea sp. CACIAM 22H2]MBN9497961.1 YbaB/EbfC family nucleoid-associated protein [Alphaproteobacteria bacterium]
MKNLGALMKQAQQMQSKMAEMQEKLGSLEVQGRAGGGMVEVTTTAKGDVRRVKIDPALLVPADVEVLEDLIVAAMADAKGKADAAAADQMREVTGGLSLPPGMKLPF